jgi:hypothetical protein
MTTRAPAPSDVCELFPAVTVPLAANTGSTGERFQGRVGARPLVEGHRACSFDIARREIGRRSTTSQAIRP